MPARLTRRPSTDDGIAIRFEELAVAAGADAFETALSLAAARVIKEGELVDRVEAARRRWPQLDLQALAVNGKVAPQLHELLAAVDQRPELLDALFEHLTATRAKGSKGQYFTPAHIVDFCVQLARPHGDVCDPACGAGGFLLAAAPHASCLHGFDIDRNAVRTARLRLLMRNVDAEIVQRDTLQQAPPGRYDAVITNPPFAGEVAYNGRRAQRDVLFLERCVAMLRPSGTLTIILPHNKFAGKAFIPLRRWLLQRTQVLAVIALGRTEFLPHTHQQANVLHLSVTPRNHHLSVPIFFAISERPGKDSRGRRTPHDLDEIAAAYHDFRKAH